MLVRNWVVATFLAIGLMGLRSQTAHGGVIITEVMYNPATSEPGGEWVEIFNGGVSTVDLTGWQLDDEDATDWGTMIGSLASGQVGVIYNSGFTDDAAFRTAWNISSGVMLFGVSWAGLANTPSAANEQLRLVDGLSTMIDTVNYDDANGWPSNVNGLSIYLTDLALDNDLGSSWALSTVGSPGVTSPLSPFSSDDLGSPGFVSLAATVPEPSSWAVFVFGGAAFWRLPRRGRRDSAL